VFVKGIEAAYRPIFSPDGQSVAFYGCDGAIAARAPNPASCYALYVADVSGKWTRLADVANPGPPVFSTDGRWIYAWSSDDLNADPPKDRGGCLWRVEARAPFARQTLFCNDQLESASLYVDPASETAVVGGAQRGAVDGGVSYAWLSLPDGRLLKTARVPRGDSLSLGSLGPGGHLVTWAGPDLVAVDLETGKRAVLVPGKTGLTFPSSQWDGDRVYALRTNQGKTEEILRIDVASALAHP
jgi:hypothetical protein